MAAFVGAAVGVTFRDARTAAICGRSLSSSARSATRATAPIRMMEAMNDDEPRVTEDAKLFVGNLSWSTTDESLGVAFEEFGTVLDARVVMDRFTGKSRGFGFVTYDTAPSADQALEGMNGREVDGRAIRVDRANSRPPRRERRPREEMY
ncbi:hypothetical protein MMPV_005012 [Pyropia vietnamensis]